MKRALRYGLIRLFGREFMALSRRDKAVGLWWCGSLCLGCGWCGSNPWWTQVLVIGNFAVSSWLLGKTGKIR